MLKRVLTPLVFLFLATTAFAATWTPRAPLPEARCAGGSGVALVNGSIFLIEAKTDEYSLAGNSWSSNAPNPRPDGLTNHNSNAVLGNSIYFFGGTKIGLLTNTSVVDRYDAASDSWTLGIANYPLPVAGVGTIAQGGKIFCVGGEFFGVSTIAAHFNPIANNFFILASIPTGRIRPVVVEHDGKVWVIGGRDAFGAAIPGIDVFDPAFGSWSAGPSLPLASHAHAGGVVGGDLHVLLDAGVYRLSNGSWTQVGPPAPQAGDFAAIFVDDELHAIGGCSTEHYALQIAPTVADTTAPVIASVTPSISVLAPPNHKMVPVTISVVASDDTDPAPVAQIASVTSNEPDNGLGDGDTPNDIVITGPLSVELRAERGGKGTGRTYTITVAVTDASGNQSTASTTVVVSRK